MTITISRLYPSHREAREAVRALEGAGVKHGDISILVSNADGSYDEKNKTFPDRDLERTVPEDSGLPLSLSNFLQNYHGFVAGKP